jgi:hypothetical protein
MQPCLKCGDPRAAESVFCNACRNLRFSAGAAQPHLRLVTRGDGNPRQEPRLSGELRPFVIAGIVFLLLLVGSRFGVGYYAARAAKAMDRQTMADTIHRVDPGKTNAHSQHDDLAEVR